MISGSSLAWDDDISGACWAIGLRILHFHKQELHIHIRALIYIYISTLGMIPSHCLSPPRLSVSSQVRAVSLSSSSSSSSLVFLEETCCQSAKVIKVLTSGLLRSEGKWDPGWILRDDFRLCVNEMLIRLIYFGTFICHFIHLVSFWFL